MGIVNYDEIVVTDFKKVMNECNSDMLEAVKNISNEVDNIEETLKTPKSVLTTSTYNDYFKSKVDYLNRYTNGFNNLFDDMISIYQNSYDGIDKMVGGK